MTDHSAVASLSVVAAAAAAATAATPSSPPTLDETNASFSITESMVSFLRIEAHHADDKAKRLRKQAAEIAEQFGITEESQQIYDLDPTELPPLDEKGLPKYKGKKRGRKLKAKKRKMKPDRPKRKHTGYTLFMQKIYPSAKSEYPDLPSKDIIRLVARRWKDLESDGRTAWKERALQATEDCEARGHTITNINRNEDDRIDAAVSGTNYSYLTSKDGDDNVEVRETRDKHKDDIGTEQVPISNPHLERNREEDEDDDIDRGLAGD